MSLVTAEGVTLDFGSHVCFRDANFIVHPGARVGLIGSNGTGKTTLLSAIRGELDHPGSIHRRKGLSISSLEQNPDFPPGVTVMDAITEAVGHVREIEVEMHTIHVALEDTGLPERESQRLMSRLSELERRFSHMDGYNLDRRIDLILDGLGLPRERRTQDASTLSGGEKSRLALARLLLSEPDLWLLDEPTNHLDLDGLAFLEDFLAKSQAAAVVVSHDRYFLDHVTTETWELEGDRLWVYPAPYSESRQLREERLKAARREYEKQREHVARQEEYIRKYGAGQRAKEAKGRAKRLGRLERIESPIARARAMAFQLPKGNRLGDRVLSVSGLSSALGGKTLFCDLEFELENGEALGIVGPNGTGKTTLLKTINGEIEPDAGDVTWGTTVQRAVLAQHEELPQIETTPLGFLQSSGTDLARSELLSLLGAMLFSGEAAEREVNVLSGGAEAGLILARMMLEGRNVLLLDEPTNHLDASSREVLENSLCGYDAVVVVSHDRYFLDRVVDRVLWLDAGEWRITRGGYTEASLARRQALSSKATPERKQKPVKPRRPRRPARKTPKTRHSRLTTEELEEKIIELEEKREELQFRLSDPEVVRSPETTKVVRAEIDELEAEIAEYETEYGSRES